MEQFTATTIHKEKSVHVTFGPGFSDDHWDELSQYAKGQIEKGLIYWDLDMRRMTYMNSLLLGLIVGFNSELVTAGGQLRLIVAENSMINQLLTISKMRRIVTVLAV